MQQAGLIKIVFRSFVLLAILVLWGCNRPVTPVATPPVESTGVSLVTSTPTFPPVVNPTSPVTRTPPTSPTSGLRPFPDTTGGIFVFNDQLATSGMTEEQFAFAATHYAGTQKVTRADAAHLRQYNPGFLVLHYRLGQALGRSMPDDSCEPGNDLLNIIQGDEWVPEWPGEYNVLEEWFYHWNGSRVFNCQYGHYLMNLDGTGWRDWWSAQVIQQLQENEADGLFADSYNIPSYGFTWKPPLPEVDEAFEQEWATRQHAFTDFIQERFAGTWKWIPNIGSYITTRDPSDYSNTDGVMIEGFAEWGGGSYFDPTDWQLQMDRLLRLSQGGKIILLQNYPNAEDTSERLFLLASYLLVKGEHTYINMDIGEEPEWFPEYQIDLGNPVDALPAQISAFLQPGSDVYVRRYARGMVYVNPFSETRRIQPPDGYLLVQPQGGGILPPDGKPAGSLLTTVVPSLELQGYQAAIFINSQ